PVVAKGDLALTPVEGIDTGAITVATFTDPGGAESLSDYSATIDWGDGTSAVSGTISLTSGVFTVQGHHAYGEESAADHSGSNPYQIKIVVTHEKAPAATVISTATVADPSVVPTGGFVIKGVEGAATGLVTVATFTDPGGPEQLADYSAS